MVGGIADAPSSALTSDDSGGASMGIIGGVAGALVLLIAIALVAFFITKKKKKLQTTTITAATADGIAMGVSASSDVKNMDVATLAEPATEQLVTFEEGSLGIGLHDADGAVRVSSVEAGSQADKNEVLVGSILLGVNDAPTTGLEKATVLLMIKSAGRPFKLRFQVPAAETESKI